MNLEKVKDMIRFNFGADAFALGYHWTYDPGLNFETISKNEFQFIDPLASRFHNRKAGEFAAYGDQNLALLKSMCENKKFIAEAFKKTWLEIWTPDYDEWIDGATQETLETGSGSSSNDLSPVGRISPLFLENNLDLPALEKNVETYIALTHNNPDVIDYGKFVAALIFKLNEQETVDKKNLSDIITSIKSSYPNAEKYIDFGIKILKYTPEELIKGQFPTYCEIDGSGPLTIYLLLKFWDNNDEMFKWNAILDGDSCSRAGILASIIGACGTYPEFAKNWYESLKRESEIEVLLEKY